MFWPFPSGCASTCITAGAVIRAFVGALLTGVVTEGALVPLCKTPPLTPVATSAIVEEPAGGRRGWTQEMIFWCLLIRRCQMQAPSPALGMHACMFGVQVLVRHHDIEQLVQSSFSGPVHCRHVTSHRWHFPCGLKYSPADGEQHKRPLKSSFMTISNEIPILQGSTAQFYSPSTTIKKNN